MAQDKPDTKDLAVTPGAERELSSFLVPPDKAGTTIRADETVKAIKLDRIDDGSLKITLLGS